MSDVARPPDQAERERALDTSRSFIVQAPAGSGKTGLLIQRYLALLAIVDRPEEIVAITFTIKAAAEMRARVLGALEAARSQPRPAGDHEARTWELARAALARNDKLGWKLGESAARLRVQTIDALCASLTRQMPVLSRFGAQPESVEDASGLYREAARNLLKAVEEGGEAAADLARLLSHLDNDAEKVERLVAGMLERRDHWIRTLRHAHDRAALEATLEQMRRAAVERAAALWPAGLAAPRPGDVPGWMGAANACLTKAGKWRKDAPARLQEDEGLGAALADVQALPEGRYPDEQWDALEAIVRLAPRAIAELHLVFARRGQADFIEVAQGALRALGTDEAPTDLMLALDYRIRHLLVDEFQDTSSTQFELLERLTGGWEPADGRTLFLVGDPMQSIYRFRQAEVGRFIQAWNEGIGGVRLETLGLTANFRSQAGVVSWVNACFARVMPGVDDIPGGAVKYCRTLPVRADEGEAVVVHPFFNGDRAGEAGRVVEVARRALAQPARDPQVPSTVAILVRSRAHLQEILPRLREAGLAFRAIEIEPLGHRPVVQDLLALTRALTHLADVTAWLAVLRAPWCGLRLADLLDLGCAPGAERLPWALMNDAACVEKLSPDARARIERVRDVLARALSGRRRTSLRRAVEGAWLALGGPGCVASPTELEEADIYLDHLEASEAGGALRDAAAFEETVARLFALPDLEAPERLQVMTIHKAKGLEFDTVIVPGLDSTIGSDDKQLFTFAEAPDGGLLLAPINATGEGDDPIYRFIRAIEKRKDDHESARLLYVAATRARRQLHLLGCATVDAEGSVREPPRHSLLRKLWPVVSSRFVAPAQVPARTAGARGVGPAAQGMLRRFETFPEYEMPAAARWPAPPEATLHGDIEFSWASDTARRIGSVVHRWLQRIADEQAAGWDPERLGGERASIRRQLAAMGVAEPALDEACERVVAALARALRDPRGRWILGPRKNARNEYRLTAVVGGVRFLLAVDRMFDDDEGRRWIVDYKTSTHHGGTLEAFLDAEEERYREQLERYAAAVGEPRARRALYFPLVAGWREWPREVAPPPGTQGRLF